MGWMAELRKGQGLTLAEMARKCDKSVQLLDYLENGSRTLPSLAVEIGDAYGMSDDQVREICKDFICRVDGANGRGETLTDILDLSTRGKPRKVHRKSPERNGRATLAEQREARASHEQAAYDRAVGDGKKYKLCITNFAGGNPYIDVPRLTARIAASGKSESAIGVEAGCARTFVHGLIVRGRDDGTASWPAVDLLCGVLGCRPWEILRMEG